MKYYSPTPSSILFYFRFNYKDVAIGTIIFLHTNLLARKEQGQ